jgi:hypothetical protein
LGEKEMKNLIKNFFTIILWLGSIFWLIGLVYLIIETLSPYAGQGYTNYALLPLVLVFWIIILIPLLLGCWFTRKRLFDILNKKFNY